MSTPAAPATEQKVESLEATDWGSGKGLLETMADFDFDAQNEPASLNTAPPVTTEQKTVTQETVPATPVEPVKPVEPELPVMEEDFFSEPVEKPTEKKEDETGFDEKAFDAQTDEDARSLDPKAGAKFKELRSQLKEFKQREASKLVPEDTKRELEELRLAAAEREGLKQRISEISSQSAKLQMENEPEYQTQVLDIVADAFTRAEDLAKMYEGDPAILKAIIRERDQK